MYLAYEEAGLIVGTEEWEQRQMEKVWESVEKESEKKKLQATTTNAIS